jgi:uncharacterized membrane protein YgcG
MTTAADDASVEEAFEAFLAGRPVPEQGASLAAFAGAVRSSASAPGRPNAALADLLANGLLTDRPSTSGRTAPRRRRRLAMLFPALIAKIASAGAIAQAAAGAGIVVVAFTGAGVAGALPDSLQHGFATVASTVGIQVQDPQQAGDVVPTTPSTPTSDGTEGAGSGETPAAGDATDAADDGYTFEEWKAGPEDGESFGDWVSRGARHGYADGAIISQKAHQRGVVLPTETAEPTADSTDDAEQTSNPTSARHGHGNGGNRGPGGSGHGTGGGNGSHGQGNGGHGHGEG